VPRPKGLTCQVCIGPRRYRESFYASAREDTARVCMHRRAEMLRKQGYRTVGVPGRQAIAQIVHRRTLRARRTLRKTELPNIYTSSRSLTRELDKRWLASRQTRPCCNKPRPHMLMIILIYTGIYILIYMHKYIHTYSSIYMLISYTHIYLYTYIVIYVHIH